eukprot:9478393-Pyramimonas_sp.AAC.1
MEVCGRLDVAHGFSLPCYMLDDGQPHRARQGCADLFMFPHASIGRGSLSTRGSKNKKQK